MKNHKLQAPSDEFEDAFRNGFGGCSSQCHCGRICFDTANSYDWEEGELEKLLANAKLWPDKYIELPYSASGLTVNGKDFVMGCPCNGARPYEDFIRSHAEKIAKFLNALAKQHSEKSRALVVAGKLSAASADDLMEEYKALAGDKS